METPPTPISHVATKRITAVLKATLVSRTAYVRMRIIISMGHLHIFPMTKTRDHTIILVYMRPLLVLPRTGVGVQVIVLKVSQQRFTHEKWET